MLAHQELGATLPLTCNSGIYNGCNTNLSSLSYNPLTFLRQTISVCASHSYEFSVWLRVIGVGTSGVDHLSVNANARNLSSIIAQEASLILGPSLWQQYNSSFTVGPSDTSIDVYLEILGFVVSSNNYFELYIDDFGITDLGSSCGDLPPEPTELETLPPLTELTTAIVTQQVTIPRKSFQATQTVQGYPTHLLTSALSDHRNTVSSRVASMCI